MTAPALRLHAATPAALLLELEQYLDCEIETQLERLEASRLTMETDLEAAIDDAEFERLLAAEHTRLLAWRRSVLADMRRELEAPIVHG